MCMAELEHRVSGRQSTALIAGVFLVSSGLLAFEIAFARLMSVILSYHYVFAVVSLSVFGLGAGGIVVHLFRQHMPYEGSPFGSFSLLAGLCSLTMTFSVIIALRVDLNTPGADIFLYCGIFFIPFLFGGMFLAQVFRFFPALSSKLYGSDLAGAAAGCTGVVIALNVFSTACAVFFFATVISVASLLFSAANEINEQADGIR
ncbi:MAG: hypothetical protein C4530_24730 [Desulfobacteraceae bacterium]|nr:MAG: hypothetical protein C4530_24730 [Desulfobacteraceae bacterium]